MRMLTRVATLALLVVLAGAKMQDKMGKPAAKPPPPQKPKTSCADVECKNGTPCKLVKRQEVEYPKCDCTGTSYKGKFCEHSPEEEEKIQEQKTQERKNITQAIKTMQEKRDAFDQKLKDKCLASGGTYVCPNRGNSPKKNMCVKSPQDCFVDAEGKYSDTLAKAEKEARKKCEDNQYFCFKEDECVAKGVACMPTDKCDRTRSFRCPSWKCAENKTVCDTDPGKPPACPSGETRCPDAMCYTGSSLKDCTKRGVQWDGCPATKPVQCNSGRRGYCAETKEACEIKVGCTSPLVACGFVREPGTGKPVIENGKPKPICNATCTGQDRRPKPKKQTLNPSNGGTFEVESEGGGKKAMSLKIRKGSFTVGKQSKEVEFNVMAVPDSLVQEGAFKEIFEAGAIVGSLIQIEPSEPLDADMIGVTLDIPILDPAAQKDSALCKLVLSQTEMVSLQDITNVDEVYERVGVCEPGEVDVCSCAVNISHFSTYTIVDSGIAFQPSPPPPPPPPPPTYSHEVRMEVKLPYTVEAFDDAKQDTFKKSVADAAGVDKSVVSISNIVSARRSGSVKFDVTVKAASKSLADTIASGLTAEKLNEKLKANGMQVEVTITKAPQVAESGAPAALSDAALPSSSRLLYSTQILLLLAVTLLSFTADVLV